MSDLRPSCDTTTLLKVVVRDVGGAVPQRERRSRIHTAHRLGNRAGGRAMPAGAVADVFADEARGPFYHLTPIAHGPFGIQIVCRLEATHGRALNVRAKRDAEWAKWGPCTRLALEAGGAITQKRSPIVTAGGGVLP